jgi:transposase
MCEKTFVGLDVHKDTTTIVAIDGSGKSRVESVVITDAKVICATLLSLPGEVHITFEVGTQSNWLYRQTKAVVKEVIVCNARENKLVQVGNKSDLIDAGKLAELLRLGALKAVWQHSAEQVYLKELVRIYENLVVDSTRVMNRVKAIYRGFCVATSDQLFYEIEGRDKRLAKLTEKGSRFRAEMLFTQLDK